MFHISLQSRPPRLKSPEDVSHGPYSEEEDDVRSILFDICDTLQELEVAIFSVGGFGQAEWPVDVRSDLLICVEQIGDVLDAIKNRKPADLSFPEQGIQRSISIKYSDGLSQLACTSFGNWRPNGELEHIDTFRLQESLSAVATTFIALAGEHCPLLCNHAWFQEWKIKLLHALSEE
jgi:hypothetical protein